MKIRLGDILSNSEIYPNLQYEEQSNHMTSCKRIFSYATPQCVGILNMIIWCYPTSEHMIKANYYKWWRYTPDGIKLNHTLDGTKVKVSSQIFGLGLFYKFIVQHKNLHLQHRHQMNFGKWYEFKFSQLTPKFHKTRLNFLCTT